MSITAPFSWARSVSCPATTYTDRSSDSIQIANYGQTVTVIGCIKALPSPLGGHPACIARRLRSARYAAATSADGTILTLSIVTPTDEPVRVKVDLNGATLPKSVTSWTITGPDHRACNAPGRKRVVDAEENGSADISNGFGAPALSSVLYRIEL